MAERNSARSRYIAAASEHSMPSQPKIDVALDHIKGIKGT